MRRRDRPSSQGPPAERAPHGQPRRSSVHAPRPGAAATERPDGIREVNIPVDEIGQLRLHCHPLRRGQRALNHDGQVHITSLTVPSRGSGPEDVNSHKGLPMRGLIAYPGDGVFTQHRSPPLAAPQAFSIPGCRRLPSAGPLPIPRHTPGPSPMSLIRRRRPLRTPGMGVNLVQVPRIRCSNSGSRI
jgi:hypothetical protein